MPARVSPAGCLCKARGRIGGAEGREAWVSRELRRASGGQKEATSRQGSSSRQQGWGVVLPPGEAWLWTAWLLTWVPQTFRPSPPPGSVVGAPAPDLPGSAWVPHGFYVLTPVQVFSSHESSHEEPPQPFPQLARTKGSQQVGKGPQPALKSCQSVVALQGSTLVANQTRAFQEQEQGQGQGEPCVSSTPRFRKVVRQASVDDSGEEGEA